MRVAFVPNMSYELFPLARTLKFEPLSFPSLAEFRKNISPNVLLGLEIGKMCRVRLSWVTSKPKPTAQSQSEAN